MNTDADAQKVEGSTPNTFQLYISQAEFVSGKKKLEHTLSP